MEYGYRINDEKYDILFILYGQPPGQTIYIKLKPLSLVNFNRKNFPLSFKDFKSFCLASSRKLYKNIKENI